MNRYDWFFGQYVSQAEMDEAFWWAEVADHAISTDCGLVGVCEGFGVTEHAPTPDLTVDIGGPGAAYDRTGQRCYLADALTILNCAVDEYGVSTAVTTPGWERYLGIFLQFKRVYSDPKVDRNGVTVYTHQSEGVEIVVRQGTAAVAGAAARVGLLSNALLLADVLLPFGATQILNAAILTDRREDWVRQNFAPPHVIASFAAGTPGAGLSALLAYLNEHVSDLGLYHGSGALAHVWTSTWFGAEALTSITVGAALNEIVADLAEAYLRTDPPATTGAARVGTHGFRAVNGYVEWGNPAVASVQAALETIAAATDGHIAGGAPAHPAAAVTFAPYSWIAAVNVQLAIQEIVDDLGSQVALLSGARQIGVEAITGSPDSLGAGTLFARLGSLLGLVNARARIAAAENITGDWRFDGSVRAKTLNGGGVPPAMNHLSGLSSKAFWGDSWGSALDPRNTCDLTAYLGVGPSLVDVATGFMYGGSTRPGKQYLYLLTNGPGAAPSCSVLVVDPDTMGLVATWSLNGLAFAGHVAGNFTPSCFCTDGVYLFIAFQDVIGGDFVGCVSATDGTVGWGGAVFSLGGPGRLAGTYADRIIVANSNTDLVVLCGNVAAGGIGLLRSCDKNGVARWGGAGRDGDAILGTADAGLCSDGTNVYFVTYDAGGPNAWINAALISTGLAPALMTPFIGAAGARILDLVFDGRFVVYGTTNNVAGGAFVKHYDTVANAAATRFNVANVAGPPLFVPSLGTGCHDGDHICLVEYDDSGANPFERLRLLPCGDLGDPWKAGATPSPEPRGAAHFVNPVGVGPVNFTAVGRCAFDGGSVFAVVNSGPATGRNMIRRLPRANYRG